MIVKMNGKRIAEYENGIDVSPIQYESLQTNILDNRVHRVFKNAVLPLSAGAGVLSMSVPAHAATREGINLADRLMPIISMIQELALPVGIGVATWGLVEVIIGNFGGGRQKIKYAVIGFVGMFIIPEVFYAIKDAFQI